MVSGEYSADRLERMDAVLAGYVERQAVPGLVALIHRRGETRVTTLGTLALDGDAPMQRDTLFRIASMTKPITAVATMMLVEECKLRLDDPVDEFLPELAGRQVLKRIDGPVDDTVPAKRPITTRDLLSFTAGYGLVIAPPDTYPIQAAVSALGIVGYGPPDPAKLHTPDEWLAALGTLPLFHQPGEGWMYNIGSYVLGILVARAAGQPFDAFLEERIFDPLGMTDTGFHVQADKRDRLATSYAANPETGALEPTDKPDSSRWNSPPVFPDGGGGLLSTVDDMLVFGRMLLDRGRYEGRRVLSRPAVELMMSDRLTPEQKQAVDGTDLLLGGHGWGFGAQVITHADNIGLSPGTYAWSGGHGTTWWVDPREEMIGVLMTQTAMTSATGPTIFNDFWTTAYAAIDD